MKPPYTSKDVMKVGEFSKGKFDQWLQRGIARPSSPCRGRGHAAKWDTASVVALVLTKRLGDAGIALPKAADLAQGIIGFLTYAEAPTIDENHEVLMLAVNIRTLEWCELSIMEKKLNGDIMLVVNLADLALTTIDRLEELP